MVAPDISSKQLTRWRQKGLIERLMNGVYRFPAPLLDQREYWFIANKMHEPSYVSGQTILSHAGLIPETIDVTVSMTSKPPAFFETPVGRFRFHHCKPSLMFGYHVEHLGPPTAAPVRVADTEKAILDYLYLNAHLDTLAAMEELRFNPLSWQDVDQQKLDLYLALFDSKRLTHRLSLLRTAIDHASTR